MITLSQKSHTPREPTAFEYLRASSWTRGAPDVFPCHSRVRPRTSLAPHTVPPPSVSTCSSWAEGPTTQTARPDPLTAHSMSRYCRFQSDEDDAWTRSI